MDPQFNYYHQEHDPFNRVLLESSSTFTLNHQMITDSQVHKSQQLQQHQTQNWWICSSETHQLNFSMAENLEYVRWQNSDLVRKLDDAGIQISELKNKINQLQEKVRR